MQSQQVILSGGCSAARGEQTWKRHTHHQEALLWKDLLNLPRESCRCVRVVSDALKVVEREHDRHVVVQHAVNHDDPRFLHVLSHHDLVVIRQTGIIFPQPYGYSTRHIKASRQCTTSPHCKKLVHANAQMVSSTSFHSLTVSTTSQSPLCTRARQIAVPNVAGCSSPCCSVGFCCFYFFVQWHPVSVFHLNMTVEQRTFRAGNSEHVLGRRSAGCSHSADLSSASRCAAPYPSHKFLLWTR